MEELKNEQMEKATQPATAENEESGVKQQEISLGKFKDVSSLLNAYNSLQAEFTKRCQRIKELEGLSVTEKQQSAPLQTGGNAEKAEEGISEEVKQKIIKDYLKSVLNKRQNTVVLSNDGATVITPVNRPKTIDEAGKLAKKLLQK